MTKLIVVILTSILSLGLVAGSSLAQAAPNRPHCTGTDSVWDDTDIVHLTKTGDGTLTIGWNARGHTTLDCGKGSPLTDQVVRIHQHVEARVSGLPGAVSLKGNARTQFMLPGRVQVATGDVNGDGTCAAAVCNVSFVLTGTDGGIWRLHMSEQGMLNLGTKQWQPLSIIAILIG